MTQNGSFVPEMFSALAMHGNRHVFDKRLGEGYTELTYGSGKWIGSDRVVAMFAFSDISGRVATYESPKFDDGEHTMHGKPFEQTFETRKAFSDYCKDRQIELDQPQGLAQILAGWKK